ncbi:hypothetical protein D9611_014393 [Ephemerocybe angulata]|uniref:Uncharacterized protein n=1 Tax=Ephemerocybe angulata TaxID=980116 RepID=A0A8H5ARC8_9AGAR|nr:hypothetical protein D9611_014393 [Tulosesus angulatus]
MKDSVAVRSNTPTALRNDGNAKIQQRLPSADIFSRALDDSPTQSQETKPKYITPGTVPPLSLTPRPTLRPTGPHPGPPPTASREYVNFNRELEDTAQRVAESKGRAEAGLPVQKTGASSTAQSLRQTAAEMLNDGYWDLRAHDTVRVASGFLDAHLQDLVEIQERTLAHHENLLRTRILTQKVVDALNRAMYSHSRAESLKSGLAAASNANSTVNT